MCDVFSPLSRLLFSIVEDTGRDADRNRLLNTDPYNDYEKFFLESNEGMRSLVRTSS